MKLRGRQGHWGQQKQQHSNNNNNTSYNHGGYLELNVEILENNNNNNNMKGKKDASGNGSVQCTTSMFTQADIAVFDGFFPVTDG